jgi:endonuclease/exonuclease/phosphatase family metal-dependent hydrolase
MLSRKRLLRTDTSIGDFLMKPLHNLAPTLLGALTVVGLVALLGVLVAGIFALYPFGHDWAVAAVIGVLLVGILFGPRLRHAPALEPSATTRTNPRRILGHARKPLAAVLVGWLGLIGWSQLSPGGPPPEPKTDPASIRVVTWNIHCGGTEGPVWERFNWSERRHALHTALVQCAPDVLCVQEARHEQVVFIGQALPAHVRVGVGRDDGGNGGEFCAIYFRRDRLELVDSGTFWLEEPIDQPGGASVLDCKRICTWVRLRDRTNGRILRVYNTHLYLTEGARQSAAQLIRAHLDHGESTDAVILCGDFNATPTSPTWRLLMAGGLNNSAELAGHAPGTPTYHCYGIRVRCIDGILVNSSWQVRRHGILDVKPGNRFPSDHFGVLADLALAH